MSDSEARIIPFTPNKRDREQERKDYIDEKIRDLDTEIDLLTSERNRLATIRSRLGQSGLSLVEEV